MRASPLWARAAYLLAALGFGIGGWRENGLIIPLAGAAVAVVLVLLAQHNGRRRHVNQMRVPEPDESLNGDGYD